MVALDRTFARPKAEPFGDTALFAALRKYVPLATVERPTAVRYALALVACFYAILADVKAFLLTRNLAQIAAR